MDETTFEEKFYSYSEQAIHNHDRIFDCEKSKKKEPLKAF